MDLSVSFTRAIVFALLGKAPEGLEIARFHVDAMIQYEEVNSPKLAISILLAFVRLNTSEAKWNRLAQKSLVKSARDV